MFEPETDMTSCACSVASVREQLWELEGGLQSTFDLSKVKRLIPGRQKDLHAAMELPGYPSMHPM